MNTNFRSVRSTCFSLALVLGVSVVLAGCKSGGGSAVSAATSSASPAAPVVANPVTPTPVPVPAPIVDPVTAPGAPVTPANSAPKLSGSGVASVTVDSTYSFMPAASDADGDALSFQIQNKPVWATFSTVNGKLSGTPKLENAGTHANIVISASDGKATTALPAFSIAVNKAAAGTASLAWTAPTQNVDGSTLADLAGFTVVYGMTQAALDKTIRIDNSSVTQYMVQSLPAGTYYFAVKAFSASGAESALSTTVSKSIL